MRHRSSNLRLRGTVFWFRRRVPGTLTDRIGRGEIARSLRTSCPREASRRARILWLATDRVFSLVAGRKSLEREQVELILRRLLEESIWDSPSADELMEGFRQGDLPTIDRIFGASGTEAILGLPDADREAVLHHLERMMDKVAVATHAGAAEGARLETRVADIRRWTAEADALKRTGKAIVTLRSVGGPSAPREAPASLAAPGEDASPAKVARPAPHAPRKRSSPRFSDLWAEFLAEKRQSHDEHRGYSDNTAKQSNATFGLFLELVGDKPVGEYTGADAGQFRKLLLRLPQSHGKGRAAATGAARIDALEQIRRADARDALISARNSDRMNGSAAEPSVPRVKLKTVKRHFSTLTQYFEFLMPLGHVEKNIFMGFKYPGTKSGRRKRDDWSAGDLNALLRSDWFSRKNGRKDYRWMTAIAMFSGMRAEEIARLRCADVQEAGGILFFDICEQPDGWTPKTEAGVRRVPVHPFLLEIGFRDYLEQRRSEGGERLFPGLVPYGPDGKLSGGFSRDFSRQKIKLGIGPKTVLHSFRHSVRTILTNKSAAEFRDAWIDSVMGHSADDKRVDEHGARNKASTGEITYTKEIFIRNMLLVVAAIEYPEEVELAWLRNSLAVHSEAS